jgi:hypothetical protein
LDFRRESLSHNVYFGSTSPGTFQGNVFDTSFDSGPLEAGTTYYWRVDEVDEYGTVAGAVWSFTTAFYLGDFDNDGDVDQEDFGLLQRCLSGKTVPQLDPTCSQTRLDNDQDVDETDVELFMYCLSGADIAPREACLSSSP